MGSAIGEGELRRFLEESLMQGIEEDHEREEDNAAGFSESDEERGE